MAIHAKATVMMKYFQELHGLHTVPASLLLMQSLHLFEAAPLNTPSWSLSTEWWVYVLFPFLVKPFFKLTGVGRTAILAGIAPYFWHWCTT
jgi:peptidoglycan/LPS O-acetylase OafA/YrhL